jgi:hypothetical protein|tara:strand:- start:1403 stop:1915 length:513 start_codon:yes stop_codon:yes gene_type:complete
MYIDPDIKKYLRYDAETGKIFWKLNKGSNGKAGNEAGGQNCGYLRIKLNRKYYKTHRIAWLLTYGSWPKDQIDHINGNGLDNRLENLRAVSPNENSRNQKLHKNNTSGTVGVYFNKIAQNYQASIKINGKKKHLGCFKNKEEAVAARAVANIKYNFHENHGRKEINIYGY